MSDYGLSPLTAGYNALQDGASPAEAAALLFVDTGPNFCPTCGAYWSCEHRETVADFIDKLYENPAWKPKVTIANLDQYPPATLIRDQLDYI